MKKLTALLLLCPALAAANVSENSHLVKINPDELQFYASIATEGSCPISSEALGEIVRGVFIRSRINPVK